MPLKRIGRALMPNTVVIVDRVEAVNTEWQKQRDEAEAMFADLNCKVEHFKEIINSGRSDEDLLMNGLGTKKRAQEELNALMPQYEKYSTRVASFEAGLNNYARSGGLVGKEK